LLELESQAVLAAGAEERGERREIRLVTGERNRLFLQLAQSGERARGRLPGFEGGAVARGRPARYLVQQLGGGPRAREPAREHDLDVGHEPAQARRRRTELADPVLGQ